MSRGDLSEAEWRLLKDLLPAERGRKSRPAHDNRTIVNGILWRLRTGAPWRDVPEKYGKWMTVYQRFRRWSEAGIWEAVASDAGPGDGGQLAPQHRLRRRSGAMSRQPAQKGDSRTGFWPLAGRVHL